MEFDPKLVREGHDPQLEKTVELLLLELQKHPIPTYKRPAFPIYGPKSSGGGGAQ